MNELPETERENLIAERAKLIDQLDKARDFVARFQGDPDRAPVFGAGEGLPEALRQCESLQKRIDEIDRRLS